MLKIRNEELKLNCKNDQNLKETQSLTYYGDRQSSPTNKLREKKNTKLS